MRLVGEQLLHKPSLAWGENCAQGQCYYAHSPGRGRRAERSAWSHQLAAKAAQGPAVVHAPFRKENPTSRYGTSGSASKGRLIAPLPFMLFEKAFHKVPEPRTNNSEMGEEGEGRECRKGVEFWALENPAMAKEEDGTEGQLWQHRQHPGEHSSLLCQFTALTPSPLADY